MHTVNMVKLQWPTTTNNTELVLHVKILANEMVQISLIQGCAEQAEENARICTSAYCGLLAVPEPKLYIITLQKVST